jgi:class 3 adenylate cyclase
MARTVVAATPGAIESLDALAAAAIAAKDELAKNRRYMAVLFADLCDSTSYKLKRGDVDGLLKTWNHNFIVGKAVENYNGEIVKYIGVMRFKQQSKFKTTLLFLTKKLMGIVTNRLRARLPYTLETLF